MRLTFLSRTKHSFANIKISFRVSEIGVTKKQRKLSESAADIKFSTPKTSGFSLEFSPPQENFRLFTHFFAKFRGNSDFFHEKYFFVSLNFGKTVGSVRKTVRSAAGAKKWAFWGENPKFSYIDRVNKFFENAGLDLIGI